MVMLKECKTKKGQNTFKQLLELKKKRHVQMERQILKVFK
jgi:hypothetical protein